MPLAPARMTLSIAIRHLPTQVPRIVPSFSQISVLPSSFLGFPEGLRRALHPSFTRQTVAQDRCPCSRSFCITSVAASDAKATPSGYREPTGCVCGRHWFSPFQSDPVEWHYALRERHPWRAHVFGPRFAGCPSCEPSIHNQLRACRFLAFLLRKLFFSCIESPVPPLTGQWRGKCRP